MEALGPIFGKLPTRLGPAALWRAPSGQTLRVVGGSSGSFVEGSVFSDVTLFGVCLKETTGKPQL